MSPLPSAPPTQDAGAFANRRQGAPVVRPPGLAGRLVDVVPEEPEPPATAVDAMVRPGFGQPVRKCAKLERPDVAAVPRLPGPQVLEDTGIGNTRLLRQLAQCGGAHAFARPNRAFHQLDARLRVFERQNLLHR